MSRLGGLLLLLGLPVVAIGQNGQALPALSPDFMVVADFDEGQGKLHLRLTQVREQGIQQLVVGGDVSLKTEMVAGPFRVERWLTIKECKILEASGGVITPADLPRRLKSGTLVVVATDGNLPDKAFLQLLRPETVIVVGPAVKLDPRIKLPPLPK